MGTVMSPAGGDVSVRWVEERGRICVCEDLSLSPSHSSTFNISVDFFSDILAFLFLPARDPS